MPAKKKPDDVVESAAPKKKLKQLLCSAEGVSTVGINASDVRVKFVSLGVGGKQDVEVARTPGKTLVVEVHEV